MEQNINLTTSAEQKFGQIKAILYLLQTNLEEFKDEVDKSYELLKIGEMTDFSKKIETVLTNPVSHIFEISDNIDTQIKHIVHHFVLSFLQKNNSIISAAYQTKTSLNDLHYTIILKNDNIDNRNQVFDFFDKYDLLDISYKYPVYFQFVLKELEDKIIFFKKLELN